jgi:hypothetical protein
VYRMKAPALVFLLLAGLLPWGTASGESKPAASAASAPAKPASERFRLSDLLPRGLQRNPRLTLSVVTEMTPAGKAIVPPTRERPAYYLAIDGGLVEEGDVGAGERPPSKEKLTQVMQAAFVRSGYLPATDAHPPSVLIHYRWGVYNRLTGMTEEEESEDLVLRNLRTRAMLVGGSKFAKEFMDAVTIFRHTGGLDRLRLDARTDLLVTLATSDLYFLVAAAYDAEAGRRGEKKLLWTTRLTTDSQGLALNDTLPTLVSNAGNYFGHETNGSVIFHPRLFEGKVEVGEPTVVRDLPAAVKP